MALAAARGARALARSVGARASSTAPAAAAAATPTSRLIIFDTTLRDGEQSPGCTLQAREKVAIAAQLSRLGVDVCEAGFPVASAGDFDAVSRIARDVGPRVENRQGGEPMRIAGLARATVGDIDACHRAVSSAPLHRVHTFLATSDLHLKHKLNISRPEAVRRAAAAVRHAAALVASGAPAGAGDVEFSCEDAGRSDRAFLVELLAEVIAAGATTINVPDTVGYTLPHEYGSLFAHLITHTPGAGRVVWSTHCHDDLGLATANTLVAVAAGARQAEVTINGIGERAGNTALEEVVMAIATRPGALPLSTRIDTTQITRTSRMVQKLTGMAVQPNKAIVGANAFAHESGIHQAGMLKNAETYEIMRPETVGLSRSSLVLGKHSGRAAYASRLRELGFGVVEGAALEAVVAACKALADSQKHITDADLAALMLSRELAPAEPTWSLTRLQVMTGIDLRPTATATLRRRGDAADLERTGTATGTGPVDAVYHAINSVVGGAPVDLVGFSITSVTDGQNALGEVTIRVAPAEGGRGRRSLAGLKRVRASGGGGAVASASAALHTSATAAAPPPPAAAAAAAAAEFEALGAELDAGEGGAAPAGRPHFAGTAADKDIIVASARAYVAALNRLLASAAGADGPARVVVGAGEGGGV